jgi:hypothetical protein
VQLFCAELEHFNQTGFIEDRIGIRRAHQTGHAAGNRRGQLAFQHAFMFVAGLAQPRRQVDQARCHDTAPGVYGFVGHEIGGGAFQRHDAACSNGHIAHFVQMGSRVNDPAILDEEFHFIFPEKGRRAGPPQARPAPLGGSALHEVKSVGATVMLHSRQRCS